MIAYGDLGYVILAGGFLLVAFCAFVLWVCWQCAKMNDISNDVTSLAKFEGQETYR